MSKASLLVFLASLLAVSSCSESDGLQAPLTSDFDRLCEGFTQLTEHPGYKNLSSSERADALEQALVERLEPDHHAYIAWTAIQNADPAERYYLYREAAVSSGHSNWECEAMRMHSHEVGSPFE